MARKLYPIDQPPRIMEANPPFKILEITREYLDGPVTLYRCLFPKLEIENTNNGKFWAFSYSVEKYETRIFLDMYEDGFMSIEEASSWGYKEFKKYSMEETTKIFDPLPLQNE